MNNYVNEINDCIDALRDAELEDNMDLFRVKDWPTETKTTYEFGDDLEYEMKILKKEIGAYMKLFNDITIHKIENSYTKEGAIKHLKPLRYKLIAHMDGLLEHVKKRQKVIYVCLERNRSSKLEELESKGLLEDVCIYDRIEPVFMSENIDEVISHFTSIQNDSNEYWKLISIYLVETVQGTKYIDGLINERLLKETNFTDE